MAADFDSLLSLNIAQILEVFTVVLTRDLLASWPLANRVFPSNGRIKCRPQSVLIIVTNRMFTIVLTRDLPLALLAPFQCLAAPANSSSFSFSTVPKWIDFLRCSNFQMSEMPNASQEI